MRLHGFHGGLVLAGHKQVSTGAPLRACPLPPELVLPLQQHSGSPARPIVRPDDHVLGGQRIAEAEGRVSAHVHASTSGHIIAIEPRPIAHRSGLEAPCIILAPDGEDRQLWLAPLPDPLGSDPLRILERIREAGVVGLGGATFPTDAKLEIGRELLILNGAECEPWISCDDTLLRHRPADIVQGARLLAHTVGTRRLIIAVEDHMQAAIAALRPLCSDGVELIEVPTRYPEGGERQLIKMLTGCEVPSGGLPRDIGVVVYNVATAAAAWNAVSVGEPLLSRVVTVTGPGVARPCNLEVRLGTPIGFVVEHAGGYTERAERLVVGGPLMGTALADDRPPITKGSNCVLVLGADEVRDEQPELPCIRCGECARVCPAQLLPQQLYWFTRAQDWTRLREHKLADCIECGCCDLVCPSHIPLVDYYRYAKSELRAQDWERRRAEQARERFEAREQRLERERAEREARRAARNVDPDRLARVLQKTAADAEPPA